MGADYFGVRPCSLYRSLGVESFLEQIKSVAMLDGLEARRAELEKASGRPLESMAVNVVSLGSVQRKTTVGELSRTVASFPRDGIPECPPCPLSGGRALGCCRYVRYPVDATFERELFAYLLAMLGPDVAGFAAAKDRTGRDLTAGRLVYEMVMTEIDATPFVAERGHPASLATLEEPLTAVLPDGASVSSATLLQAAFHPIDGAPALQLYAMFYRDFYRWLEMRGVDVDGSATLLAMRHVTELLVAAAGMVQRREEAQVIVQG